MAAQVDQPISVGNLDAMTDAVIASFDESFASISGTLASLQDQIDQLKEEASKPVVLWSGDSDTATITGRLSDYSTLTIKGMYYGKAFSSVTSATVGSREIDYTNSIYAEITSTGTSFTVEVHSNAFPIRPLTMTSISGSKNI